jgi:hypothetical protein
MIACCPPEVISTSSMVVGTPREVNHLATRSRRAGRPAGWNPEPCSTSSISRRALRMASRTSGEGERTDAVKSMVESSAPSRANSGLRPTVSDGVTIPPAGLKPRTARTQVPLPGLESR